MDAQVKLVSKVLVLDNSAACRDSLKRFGDGNGPVGLRDDAVFLDVNY